ncbi:MAG: MaoC family dehydratase [Chloroflexi bacterium]|nr:MaoC family dehydratase [Chloroflexota bacterium]MYF78391.1 MaoC family dehydratase [Chloroflexota bacterium]
MGSVITDVMQSFIGAKSPPITYRVSHRDVARFNAAIRGVLPPVENDPDLEGNEAMIEANPLILRSFITAPFDPPFPEPFHDVLDGGSRFKFIRPVVAGDEITAVRKMQEIFEKSGRFGPMLFKITEVSYSDASGELVATQESTSISYGRPAGSV